MRNQIRLGLGLTICLSLLLAVVFAIAVSTKAYANVGIGYYDEHGKWASASIPDDNYLDEIDSDHYTLHSGWYAVKESFSDGDRPTVSGTVNIILTNGNTMTLRDGIHVPPGSTLNIFRQDGAGSGKLFTDRSKADTAAIGGDNNESAGTINIYGGNIEVRGGSHNTDGGAGIGGGNMGGAGNINIYGGNVTAKGGPNAAGIGCGDRTDGGSNDGTVRIYGGTVNATGGSVSSNGGAGIGGGGQGWIGAIEIYGGDVTARGGANAAGIGGGAKQGGSGHLTISGGTVKAYGDNKAAGIGGGMNGSGGEINISGGNITAQGGNDAAGIGGGDTGDSGSINISGGTISATGGSAQSRGGAGIGGGGMASGRSITITGGNITKAQGGANAAGIGGGDEGEGGSITIRGGTVNATGGSKNDDGGAGIGGGNEKSGGTITIGGSCNITAQGGHDGAGIGGGENGGGGTITVEGGTVNATGGIAGAGIGSGQTGEGTNKITVSGGRITAKGGELGAGIGSGENTESVGTVKISGSPVIDAEGGRRGAGIGGGDCGGRGGTIDISSGTIEAVAGAEAAGIGSGRWSNNHGNDYYSKQVSVTIDGGNIRAYGSAGGAGIGAGNEGPSGRILINNGTVYARGGNDGGSGIGSGSGCWHDYASTLTVNVTINGGDVTARAGRMLSNDKTNADPGAAIGAGGCEHAADAIDQEYEAVFRGGIYLNGGHVKAYAADITQRASISPDVHNVIGTTYAEKAWTDDKSEVKFAGATVDMYPGPGTTTGTLKQMVKVNNASTGGIKLIDENGKYQRVSFTSQYDNANTMKEAKKDYRTLVLTGAEEIDEYEGAKIQNATYKHIRVEPVHQHVFTYETATTNTQGDTIIATCTGDGDCDLLNHKAKLILSKPPHEAYGDGKDAGVIVTDEDHIGNAQVNYYYANTDGSKASAVDEDKLWEIPTETGSYWAEITLTNKDEGSAAVVESSATAHVSYTFAKATPAVKTTAVVDEGKSIDLKANVANAPEDVNFGLNDPTLADKGIQLEGSILAIPAATTTSDNPSEVLVHVQADADANHEALNETITVSVNKKARPTIGPDELTIVYGETGTSVGAQVTGVDGQPTGEVSYAVKAASTYDDPFGDDAGSEGSGSSSTGDWSENDIIKVNKTTGELVAKQPGETTVTITVAGTDFYAPTSKDVKITIKGAPLVGIGATGYTGEYDGQPHGIAMTGVPDGIGATVYYSLTELDAQNYLTNGVTKDDALIDSVLFSDAGTYTVYYFVTAPHYEPVAGSAEVTITKKPIDVTVTALDKEYDGTTGATVLASVDESALIEGDYVEVSGISGTFVNKNAEADKTVMIDTSAMTITGSNAGNYEVKIPESTTATIEKAWASVTALDDYVPMDAVMPEFEAIDYTPVEGEHIEYELSCGADTSVPGEYEIVVHVDSGGTYARNYNVWVENGTLTVTRPMTVTATGYTGTYDAAAHGISVSVEVDPSVDPAVWKDLYGFDESQGVSWYAIYYGTEELTIDNLRAAGSIISPTFTDVGTHPVYYFVLALDGQTVSGSKDVVINKAEPEITAPTPVEGLRYTGSPQTLINAGSAVGGTMEYSLDGLSWSTEPPQATDVGSHSVMYRVTGDENHLDVAARPISTVIQKKLEPTVVLDSWTYGSPDKTPVFTDGAEEIDPSLVTYSYKKRDANDSTYSSEKPTKAGDYVVRAVVSETHKYKGTYTADFSVERKPLTATVIANDKTYDGTTNASALAFIYDGVLDGDSVSVSGVSCAFEDANAGELKTVVIDPASAVISGTGSENYAVTIPDTTVATINKATAVIAADDVSITVGEPVPDPLKSYVYTAVKGEQLVYSLTCDTNGAIGEYIIDIDYDPSVVPNSNYEILCIPGKLTIGKAALSVTATGFVGAYDGAAHGITVDVLPTTANAKVYYSAERDLTPETAPVAGTLVNPTFTDAGSRRVYYCVIADDYSPVIGFKDVVIAKADPAVTAPAPAHLSYTGGPQALVTPGSAQGGTMEYSLDGNSWSTDVPVATASGAYAVLYRVIGDANHADVTARAVAATIGQSGSAGIEMYRMYNPNSGEHFYTASSAERDSLTAVGWSYEGIGWRAPEISNTPVYRLYNVNGGEHHYTTSAGERDSLVAAGWTDEGIGWYSDDAQSVPVYREYNPNAFSNNHNYTKDYSEHSWLLSVGWNNEGVAWYGL